MVFLFNEGFATPLGEIFPVAGAWSTFLGALVGIRVLLYALTTKPGENPLRDKNDLIIYFLTLFYFGPTGLILVLLFQVFGKLGVVKAITDKLPSDEHNPKDMTTIIIAALLSWVFAIPQFSFVQNILPLRIFQIPGLAWLGWVLILLAMLYYLGPRKAEGEVGWSSAATSSILLFILIIAIFGFDLLYLLFIYLLLKPFLVKLNVLGVIKGTIEKKAKKEAKIEVEEGVPGPIVRFFQAYSEKQAAEEKKRLDKLMDSMEETREEVEKLEAREKAEHAVKQKEEEELFKSLKKRMPGVFLLVLAGIVALVNDGLDIAGIGIIPFIGFGIDLLTAFFIAPYAMPILKGRLKKWTNIFSNWRMILAALPILEFVGSGPFGFLDMVPWWIFGVLGLRLLLIKTDDFAQFKKAKSHLQNLKSSAIGFAGVHVPAYTRKLVVGLILASLIIFFLLPIAPFNIGQTALAAQRYVSSGRLVLDMQQYYMEMADRISTLWTAPQIWWEQQLEVFRQDAFVSQVDQSATRELGMFWDDIMPAEREFQRGKQAIVWATLRGDVLNVTKCFANRTSPECTAYIRCRVKNAFEVEASPSQKSMLDLLGSGDSVSCKFIPKIDGVYKVEFISEFDFETRAYYPIYFADRNLVLDYAAEGKDIMDVAGITDKEPIATYTPGPIAIGIESFAKMPLRVEIPVTATGSAIGPLPGSPDEEIRGDTIGISLQNRWRPRGQLQKINNLTVIIPKNLSLADCTPAEFFEVPPKDIKAKNERHYVIDPRYIQRTLEEKETKSFRCILTAAGDPKHILTPGAEVTLHAIKVIANYKFAVTADTSVRVLSTGEPVYTYEKAQEQALDDYDACPEDVKDCAYSARQYCDADPCNQNCYWYYGPATIDRCAKCDVGCSYFDTRAYCELDPCDLGCDWNASEQECMKINIEKTIKWPTDLSFISKCSTDHIVVKGIRYVYSIESGYITESSSDKITVKHPDNIISQYSGLLERYRQKGNIAKKAVIGRLDEEVTLKITKNNKALSGKEIVKLFEDARYYPEFAKDSGCRE
ncbi:hypothetical protein KY312_02745 [Candidatus Woesearchaeota archaeon]|nr:hypothetical protein [Candidatus Woesearchaeota archaeon]